MFFKKQFLSNKRSYSEIPCVCYISTFPQGNYEVHKVDRFILRGELELAHKWMDSSYRAI